MACVRGSCIWESSKESLKITAFSEASMIPMVFLERTTASPTTIILLFWRGGYLVKNCQIIQSPET